MALEWFILVMIAVAAAAWSFGKRRGVGVLMTKRDLRDRKLYRVGTGWSYDGRFRVQQLIIDGDARWFFLNDLQNVSVLDRCTHAVYRRDANQFVPTD